LYQAISDFSRTQICCGHNSPLKPVPKKSKVAFSSGLVTNWKAKAAATSCNQVIAAKAPSAEMIGSLCDDDVFSTPLEISDMQTCNTGCKNDVSL
jgi:hypothetical protein